MAMTSSSHSIRNPLPISLPTTEVGMSFEFRIPLCREQAHRCTS